MTRAKAFSAILICAAMCLLIFLVYQQGADSLKKALYEGGPALIIISFFRFFPLGLDATAWYFLLPKRHNIAGPRFMRIWTFRWIGESINTLLPVAQVGGDFARARLLAKAPQTCTPRNDQSAGATVLVDFVLGLITQAIFTLMGVGLLISLQQNNAQLLPLTAAITFSLIIAALLWGVIAKGFLPFLAHKIMRIAPKGKLAQLSGGLHTLDAQIAQILHLKQTLFWACLLKLCAWICRSAEIWIILTCLNIPIDWQTALIIESVATAIRSAAFLIPGAIGLQDGGIILLCHWLGLPAEAGLLIAVLKRGREILTSLPGLFAWFLLEGKTILSRYPKE